MIFIESDDKFIPLGR